MAEARNNCVKRRFKWIIDGITREKLEIPTFSLHSDPISIDFGEEKTEWKGHITYEAEGYLGVYLFKLKPSDFDILVNFSISLKDISLYTMKNFWQVNKSWGWLFITFDKLFDPSENYLTDGSKIELIYDIELLTQGNQQDIPSPRNIYSKFFDDTVLANFTLISSDGETFQIHRFVLAYESDFFYKMFTIDMKEKQQGSAKFDDIDSEALKEVLNFIYNGKAEVDDVKRASKVIYAAEKFMLAGLKKICCDTLKKKISNANVIEILGLADLYQERDLEEACLKKILLNYEAVRKTEGWKSLKLPLSVKITDALYADSKIPVTILNSTL